MNGTTPSAADNYRDAYRAMNNEEATVAEVNQALFNLDIAKKTKLDPFMLAQITNAGFLRVQQRIIDELPGKLAAVTDQAVSDIKTAIPTGGETRKQLDELNDFERSLAASVSSAQEIHKGVLGFLVHLTFPLTIALFVGFMYLLVAMTSWQAYKVGRSDAGCAALGAAWQNANVQHHRQTMADLHAAGELRLCK